MKIKGEKKSNSLQMKILLLGESLIGKTCLIERYVNNLFKGSYLVTIGMDIRVKKLEINNYDVNVTINDTAGQERFRSITKMIYKGADGILVGFDLTNKESFDQVSYWLEEIEENKSKDYPISLVLFGNKCDIKDKIEVKDEDIKSLKKKYNLEYFATSAKNGTNVQKAFEHLIKSILKTRKLFEKVGLSPDIPFDNIIIKEKENEKENQRLERVKNPKKKKKKSFC